MRSLIIVIALILVGGCFMNTKQTQDPSAGFEQIRKEFDKSKRELRAELTSMKEEHDNSVRNFKDVSGTISTQVTELRSEFNTAITQMMEISVKMESTVNKQIQHSEQTQVNDPKLIIGLAIVAAATLLIVILAVLAFFVLRSLKKGTSPIFG